MAKQIVWQVRCPTCQSVTGHRRHRGTINRIDCCVCGHGLSWLDVTVLGWVVRTVTKSASIAAAIFIGGTIGLDQNITFMLGVSSLVFCFGLYYYSKVSWC
jgi:hypothetical protein